jgi:hypothetical protein
VKGLRTNRVVIEPSEVLFHHAVGGKAAADQDAATTAGATADQDATGSTP